MIQSRLSDRRGQREQLERIRGHQVRWVSTNLHEWVAETTCKDDWLVASMPEESLKWKTRSRESYWRRWAAGKSLQSPTLCKLNPSTRRKVWGLGRVWSRFRI